MIRLIKVSWGWINPELVRTWEPTSKQEIRVVYANGNMDLVIGIDAEEIYDWLSTVTILDTKG